MNRLVLSLFIALLTAIPAQAHHNYRLAFDDSVEITIEGVVTEVAWRNPHIELYLDAIDAEGNVARWSMPTAAPGVASRNGFTETTLSVGDKLVVVGWPARDGTNSMRARSLTLADGSVIPLHPTGGGRNSNN